MTTPSDWFGIKEVEDNIWIVEERGHVQSFLINGKARSALIDTGMGFRDIRIAVESLAHEDILVLNTHWHYDHIGGNRLFDKIGISPFENHLLNLRWNNSLLMNIYVNPCREEGIAFPHDFMAEKYEIQGVEPTFFMNDGDNIDLGDRALRVIATPGHTHGSLSFLDTRTNSLFTGDLVHSEAPIYAHFEDSDIEEYITSINRLLSKDIEFYRIYPSHCSYPLGKAFLIQVLENLIRVKRGGLKPEINEDWERPVHMYSFENLSILTKMPGSRGAKLWSQQSQYQMM